MTLNDERRPEDAAATTATTRTNGNTPLGAERLLTAAQLGEYLGLTAGTILDRFERGDLPGYRLFGRKGGPVRFSADDVSAFLERCRVEARPS